MLAMLLDSSGTLCILDRAPSGCALSLDADDCKEGTGRSAVDLVGEDAQGERVVDGLVEASEQLKQALPTTANQHGVSAVFIRGGGDTTHRAKHADGDLPVLDQLRDVGQRQDSRGTLRLGFLFHAVGSA